MFDPALVKLAQALVADFIQAKLTLVTAESCSGGLVAGVLTEIPGSSAVVERGFVTYSNAAKHESIGVPQAILDQFGAVSVETAGAMAQGALEHSSADIAIAITGIAGPGGATPGKPVGLVCFGVQRRGGPVLTLEKRFGDLGRSEVRRLSVVQSLELAQQARLS